MITARASSGNMTVLMSLIFGLVVAVCVIGLIVNSLMFQRTRDQHQADSVAVELAEKLNSENRIAQMNELESYSRELVFVSRQQFQHCVEQEPLLTPLANQLLNEARGNHDLVARERSNLSAVIDADVNDFVRTFNKGRANNSVLRLPWISAKDFQIREFKLGRIKDVQSNIMCCDAIPELAEQDRSRGFVDNRSGLFQAEMFVTLTADNDLKYQFAALPASVKSTCAPGRNTNDDVFRERGYLSHYMLPTAVQVVCGSDISVGNNSNSEKLRLQSTAITAGAAASDL